MHLRASPKYRHLHLDNARIHIHRREQAPQRHVVCRSHGLHIQHTGTHCDILNMSHVNWGRLDLPVYTSFNSEIVKGNPLIR
jgi:hypothetical protein